MVAITTVNDDYFELDGKRYAKIYQPLVFGSLEVGIYNVHDTRQQLLSSTLYDEVEVDSVFYGSQALLVNALLPVIYKSVGTSSTVAWGFITGGDPLAQTDLATILNAKAALTHTHTTADITNLSVYTGFDSRYYTETESDATFLIDAPSNGLEYVRKDGAWSVNTGAGANFVEIVGDTMTGALIVPDDVYAVGWDGNFEVATKNAIYDKIEAVVAGSGAIDDGVYPTGWDADTANGASRNALFDILELKPNLAGSNIYTGAGSFWTVAADIEHNFEVTTAGTDLGKWDEVYQGAGTLLYRAVNDAGDAANTWLKVTRTGYVLDTIELTATSIKANTYEIHTTNNGGSGSGFDADTLRSFAPTTAATADTISLRNSNADITARQVLAYGGSATPFRSNGTGVKVGNTAQNYILSRDSAGTSLWYIGMASNSNNDIIINNYDGGAYFRIKDGAVNKGGCQYYTGSVLEDVYHSGYDSVVGARFDTVPYVNSSGVTEIGRYLDFHFQDTGGDADNGGRLSLTAEEALNWTGSLTIAGDLTLGSGDSVVQHASSSRDKYRVWSSATYAIGMEGSSFTFGSLSNWSMTFQMASTTGDGFWWGHNTHSTAQGAMGLTNEGWLTLANHFRLGYGTSDTTAVSTTYTVQANGSYQGTDFILSSDERLKENIKDYVVKPMQTRWRTFDWIDKEKGTNQLGLIAQEVQEHHPEFVIEDEEGLLSVRYTGYLIAKMAEKDVQMTEKDKQIEDMSKRIDRLEALLTQNLNLN